MPSNLCVFKWNEPVYIEANTCSPTIPPSTECSLSLLVLHHSALQIFMCLFWNVICCWWPWWLPYRAWMWQLYKNDASSHSYTEQMYVIKWLVACLVLGDERKSLMKVVFLVKLTKGCKPLTSWLLQVSPLPHMWLSPFTFSFSDPYNILNLHHPPPRFGIAHANGRSVGQSHATLHMHTLSCFIWNTNLS